MPVGWKEKESIEFDHGLDVGERGLNAGPPASKQQGEEQSR